MLPGWKHNVITNDQRSLIAETGALKHFNGPSLCLYEVQMTIARFLIIALAAPISLAAQQPPAGLPPNPITAAFKTRIAGQNRIILQAFDSIPESKFSYKPTPAQQTIGFVAQHIADDNYFFCNNFGAMKGARPAQDTATADSVKAAWPKAQLMTGLKESFAFCDQAINQLDDAKLAEPVTITFRGNSRTVARTGMVLLHALDLADHYSQLAIYMRLNNIVPPTALPRPRPAGS
jgi:uncharacterized damage-inducible protein DinB